MRRVNVENVTLIFFAFGSYYRVLNEPGNKRPQAEIDTNKNLPRGARTLYAAQTVCEDFHSSPDDGAFASLSQNENSYITNLIKGGYDEKINLPII